MLALQFGMPTNGDIAYPLKLEIELHRRPACNIYVQAGDISVEWTKTEEP